MDMRFYVFMAPLEDMLNILVKIKDKIKNLEKV
jgi:hypothetical protein